MSALQDILDKMYVDPELLEQLGEEQKQILFIKMREEQLRRWRDNESRAEQEETNRNCQLKKNNRRIKWLTGKDGEIWVWVMGDHPADMSIEQIIDKEAREKARTIAEKEVLLESFTMDVPFSGVNLDEQQLKNQLMQVKLTSENTGETNGCSDSSSNSTKRPAYSPYEEVGAGTASGDMNQTGLTSHQVKASRKSLPASFVPATADINLYKNQQSSDDPKFLNGLHSASSANKANKNNLFLASRSHHNISSIPQSKNSKTENDDNHKSAKSITFAKEEQAMPPPIPQRPANLRRSGVLSGKPMMEEVVQFSRSYLPGFAPTTTTTMASGSTATMSTASLPLFPVVNADNSAASSTSRIGFNAGGENVSRIAARLISVGVNSSSPHASSVDSFYASNPLKTQVSTTVTSYGVNESNQLANGSKYLRFSSSPMNKSSIEEDPLYDNNRIIPESVKQTQSTEDPMVRLRSVLREQQPAPQRQMQPSNILCQIKQESSAKRSDHDMPISQNRILSVGEEIEKRQSKILEKIREQRDRLENEAEMDEQRQKKEYEEQERKAREAESQIRLIAQKAREQHRRSLRTSSSLLPVLNDACGKSLKEAIRNLPRPPKPKNRQAIIDWYKKIELPNGTGLDPKTGKPASWFHGIISRIGAEQLLANQPTAAFLVRVSERIWGYTVSYVVGDGSTKHFLVEKIPDGYQFLGTNQLVHSSLYELVFYHQTAPITAKGNEILGQVVGQTSRQAPDYYDLIDDSS